MKIFKIVFLISSLVMFSSYCIAKTPDGKTLTLTLLNNSTHTLFFHDVKGGNPGNVFYVEPTIIPPNETATVTGIITTDVDLSGQLSFLDEAYNNNVLLVFDPREFHAGQAIFDLKNSIYATQLLSREFSKSGKGRDLWVTDAKISIVNN